jgi:hypothetical protein
MTAAQCALVDFDSAAVRVLGYDPVAPGHLLVTGEHRCAHPAGAESGPESLNARREAGLLPTHGTYGPWRHLPSGAIL